MEGEPEGGFAFVRPACDSVRRAGPLAHLSGYRGSGIPDAMRSITRAHGILK